MINTEHKFIKLTSKKVDDKNYYSIHYLDETDGEIHIGFSSSSLDVISNFLKEFFIKNNDKQQKHAHWIRYEHNSGIHCSKCNHKARYKDIHRFEYCPHCGYKMDEVRE